HLRAALALDALRHHRGRRGVDRAARALEADVRHDVAVEADVDGGPVPAERVVPVRAVIRLRQLAKVPRSLGMIQDHFLVEVPQVTHAPRTSRTLCSPFTSTSISSVVL